MAKANKGRAPQGAGTIRKKTVTRKGKVYTFWEARITTGRNPGNGKQIQKSISGKTQKEVLQKMKQALAELDQGTYTEPSKLTISEWLNTWHSEYLTSVKENTRTSYRQHIDNHIVPALGAVKLSALSPDACQRFYNSLSRDKGLSPKTVKNIHGVLHEALKRAVRLGYIRSNPADSVDLPRIEKAKIEPLDAPEIKSLLNALDDGLYSTIIKVDLFTGLREGEILGLQWACVDFDKGTITIDKQLCRPRKKGEAYRLASVKNDKPRTIQPASFVMHLLKQQRKRQMEQRLLAGKLWNDNGIPDLVFTYDTGKYLCYSVILDHLRKALKAAGLPERRFHDLRHTYAVSSLQAGDDVKTVQENLGHHTAAFTLDQYGHVTDTMRQASAQRMDTYIAALK